MEFWPQYLGFLSNWPEKLILRKVWMLLKVPKFPEITLNFEFVSFHKIHLKYSPFGQKKPSFWCQNSIASREYRKGKISSKFFGTLISSWVCIYINGKFWFWTNFFMFRWVKMPPKGHDEKIIKSLISWSLCIFE